MPRIWQKADTGGTFEGYRVTYKIFRGDRFGCGWVTLEKDIEELSDLKNMKAVILEVRPVSITLGHPLTEEEINMGNQ